MTSTKQLVDRLRTVSVDDASVLSLYIGLPPDPGERACLDARVQSLLEPVRQHIDSAEIGSTTRSALRADLRRIEALVPELRATRGRGVALFTCDRLRLEERAVLPRLVRDRAVVDATPWLRPLLAVLDEPRRDGVVLVDREETWLYVVSTGELETASHIRHQVRSAGDGGEEPPGTAQAEERARHHCRDTSERVTLLVRMGKLDLLVVGGRAATVAAFLRSLPHDVREKVAGTFDSHRMTAAEVRQQTQQVIDAYERDGERRLVTEALDRVDASGEVEHVITETPLRQHVVATLTRFPVPPPD